MELPLAIPAWKVAPALPAGNTVVLKPATTASIIGAAFIEALDDAAIPAGVSNFVTGPGSVIGTALSTDEPVDAVSFTGSEVVGDIVYQDAAADQKRVQLEMGGKNPTVLPDSADLDDAVKIVDTGAFDVTGRACTACSRAIVQESVCEEFVDEIEAGVAKVNEKTTGLELHVPFGGMKASSSETYREQGDAGLDFYTITKTVYLNYYARQCPLPADSAPMTVSGAAIDFLRLPTSHVI